MRQFDGRFDAHFFEDVGAVEFHRALGDAQVVGDVLVVVAQDQLVEHFALARAQAGQGLAQALGLAFRIGLRAGGLHGLFDAVHQHVVLEGFFKEIPGAILYRLNGAADVADASARLARFASFLERAFPETAGSGGIIESDIVPLTHLQPLLAERYSQP